MRKKVIETNPCKLRIGLAVSGGADSTALLAIMAGLRKAHNFEAFVLHVDHALRTDSADDSRFVRDLAIKYELPFHSFRANIVRAPGESVEMAARRVRLAFFEKMMRELRLDAIATGHHADDVAETFLMRLARGSGADGLAGIKRISHVGEITFIRPLLDMRDADLRNFLRENNIPWREDSTNTDLSILRNNVRHRIIPWLRENLDARITEHICKSAAILRGDLHREEKPAPTVAVPTEQNPPKFSLAVTPVTGWTRRAPGIIGELPAECEISRAALGGRSLELRTRRPGDRIVPTGMNGCSRKLQDIFVTAKVPTEIRDTLPILADRTSGEVLWVPGYRIAESVKVESATAPAWRLTLTRDE